MDVKIPECEHTLADVLYTVKHGFKFSWDDFQNLSIVSKDLRLSLTDIPIHIDAPSASTSLPLVIDTVKPVVQSLFVERWVAKKRDFIPPWFPEIGQRLTHFGLSLQVRLGAQFYCPVEEIFQHTPNVHYVYVGIDSDELDMLDGYPSVPNPEESVKKMFFTTLPADLRWMEIYDSIRLQDLNYDMIFDLPSTLSEFTVIRDGFSNQQPKVYFNHFPQSLKRLKIDAKLCSSLPEDQELLLPSENLQKLNLRIVTDLKTIGYKHELPASLIELVLVSYADQREIVLPNRVILPENLETCVLWRTPVTFLDFSIAQKLQVLEIDKHFDGMKMNDLPNSLVELKIACSESADIKLPRNLEMLEIEHARKLITLQISKSVKDVEIRSCPSLETINIGECKKLKFKVSDCGNLSAVHFGGSSLTEIAIRNCLALRKIDGFGPGPDLSAPILASRTNFKYEET